MAKSKIVTLFLIALLLCSAIANASRPNPGFPTGSTMVKDQLQVGGGGVEEVEERCEGAGEEECLMRRTLAAHIDYIYTQKHNP